MLLLKIVNFEVPLTIDILFRIISSSNYDEVDIQKFKTPKKDNYHSLPIKHMFLKLLKTFLLHTYILKSMLLQTVIKIVQHRPYFLNPTCP